MMLYIGQKVWGKVRTASQACDVDLAEVQCGRHSNIERTLGNIIATIGHSNSQRTLKQEMRVATQTNYYVGKGG